MARVWAEVPQPPPAEQRIVRAEEVFIAILSRVVTELTQERSLRRRV